MTVSRAILEPDVAYTFELSVWKTGMNLEATNQTVCIAEPPFLWNWMSRFFLLEDSFSCSHGLVPFFPTGAERQVQNFPWEIPTCSLSAQIHRANKRCMDSRRHAAGERRRMRKEPLCKTGFVQQNHSVQANVNISNHNLNNTSKKKSHSLPKRTPVASPPSLQFPGEFG